MGGKKNMKEMNNIQEFLDMWRSCGIKNICSFLIYVKGFNIDPHSEELSRQIYRFHRKVK